MPPTPPAREAPVTLSLDPAVLVAMRAELPRVAQQVVDAIRAEVPSYADPFSGEMGRTIENAVKLALGGFLDLAADDPDAGPAATVEQVSEAAYGLGRGEARSGRSMEALLSAYRVGARVSWRDLSGAGVDAGLSAGTLARFAELVFAYIDQLSAASAAGHTDELATAGRVRQRYLERLTQAILRGSSADALEAAADRADWAPPRLLTAVVLPDRLARGVLGQLDTDTLQPTEQVPGLEEHPDLTVLLVPSTSGKARATLLRRLQGRRAVVGPARPWLAAVESYERALRTVSLGLVPDEDPAAEPLDTEQHLPQIVLRADPSALDDLRRQVLAPLADLKPAAAEKLRETLRSWLLHQGRRDAVAADLFVHPQTVRYRMQQLRELYGERLEDPDWVVGLTLALA
ncbi:PucR family transcriptional regulator [Nocardioides sp. HDW12B]|uniref:PucR family transcriptional regulator n=1 Tax=Nocardioides sp. HDW12B TaxID=2714939 RepID=UPI00140E10DD|nr:PucR family transcriptional regulator [Nocardioides sp. HDW12B]QIK67610.1 PucR family transcriptional regulator [Nocardioides sp. HDW12B]